MAMAFALSGVLLGGGTMMLRWVWLISAQAILTVQGLVGCSILSLMHRAFFVPMTGAHHADEINRSNQQTCQQQGNSEGSVKCSAAGAGFCRTVVAVGIVSVMIMVAVRIVRHRV